MRAPHGPDPTAASMTKMEVWLMDDVLNSGVKRAMRDHMLLPAQEMARLGSARSPC
jgi:hypothetical protein